MRILVLNSLNRNDYDNQLDIMLNNNKLFNQNEVQVINIQDMNIKSCLGCMSCVWNMSKITPGLCVQTDDMQIIYPTYIHSDIVIMITKVTFGGFSHLLKKTIERLIPVLFNAPLKKRGDETGHVMRYKNYPALLTIGIINKKQLDEKKVFLELSEKISFLFAVPFHETFFVSSLDIQIIRRLENIINQFKEGKV